MTRINDKIVLNLDNMNTLRFGRIFSITIADENEVTISEECDDYYMETMSRDDAVKLLERFIKHVKEAKHFPDPYKCMRCMDSGLHCHFCNTKGKVPMMKK